MSVKIPGKELTLGGELRILAPLNAAAVKQFREQIGAVFVGAMPDIELVAKLAFHSLSRNYPDITQAQVDDMIDYGNFFDVWEALMNLSGLAIAAGKMARQVQEQMTAATSKK